MRINGNVVITAAPPCAPRPRLAVVHSPDIDPVVSVSIVKDIDGSGRDFCVTARDKNGSLELTVEPA